jgi:hypothetical protein
MLAPVIEDESMECRQWVAIETAQILGTPNRLGFMLEEVLDRE